jgi:photosystem II stability/assembly factor-like uncharacterized protein
LINNGLSGNALNVDSLAIDPFNSSNLQLVTQGGIYKSPDAGSTWNLKNSQVSGLPSQSAIAFDPNHAGAVYVAAGALYKSLDDGETWTQVKLGSINFGVQATVLVDPKTADTLFVIGTVNSAQAVAWSPDGGGTWFWLTNGLANRLLSVVNGYAVISRTSPEVLYLPSFDVGIVSLVLQH